MRFDLPEDVRELEALLIRSEGTVDRLRPHARKRIVWAHPRQPSRTALAIVYLHGFSSTSQEIAPVCDLLASRLNANLYYPRLTGHGRCGDAMLEITLRSLLRDGLEAFAIGRRLGERVILVGTSTGATLATWIGATQSCADLASIVLLSPNFRVKDLRFELLRWRWGQRIALWIQGPIYSFQPVNERHAMHWTTRYPSLALLPLMKLLLLLKRQDLSRVTVPTLTFLCKHDQVIDAAVAARRIDGFSGRPRRLVNVIAPGDPSYHVLAGDILSPTMTDDVVERCADFINEVTV